MRISIRVLLCLAALVFAASEFAHAQQAVAHHIMARNMYVREPNDRAWQLRISGRVPSFAGIYLVVHNAQGKLMYSGHVPQGEYSADNPKVISFPADGMTGDYKINILGQQDDYLGLNLPLSDLPLEVYSATYISLGGNPANMPIFKAPPDVKELAISGVGAPLQIYDEDKNLIIDTKTNGKRITGADDPLKKRFGSSDIIAVFPVQPEKFYRLSSTAMYLQTREVLFFAFERERLFQPDTAKLDAVKWWELPIP